MLKKEEYGNLIDAGVIDPTKVTRSALQNALSIASILLTSDCLISEIPWQEDAMMPPGGGMPGGGMPGGMGGMGGGMPGMGGMGRYGRNAWNEVRTNLIDHVRELLS